VPKAPPENPSLRIRQKASGGPYAAGRTRSHGPRGSACATGSRVRGLGAGCSAGRSACPWPRHSPRCVFHEAFPQSGRSRLQRLAGWSESGLANCWPARSPGIYKPGSQPHRRLSGDCMRVLISIRLVKLGPSQRGPHKLPDENTAGRAYPTSSPPQTGVRPPGSLKDADWIAAERLAAAGKTVSFWQCRFRLQRRITTKRGWRID
jgi:hypothetical protein